MNNSRSLKKDWVITQPAFDKLLGELDADRDRAGEKYEQIRQKLMKFFKWRGCTFPEEYTDRTMDRVARRVGDGSEIRARDPYLYFHGIALNVLREHWKEADRGVETLDDLPRSQTPSENPFELRERQLERAESERRHECLSECARQLAPQNLELIAQYHQGEGGDKIARRKALAERLKIPLNALRIRTYRIRGELEACITNCLKRMPAI